MARRASQRNSGDKTLRTYLESIQPDTLVDIVMAQVAADPRLWERLSSAAVAAGAGIDEQRWRRQIDAAFEIDDFVDYREVESWVAEISNLIRRLAELIDGGQAASVVALAEHAYRCCCDAIGSVDDSDGQLVWIASEIGELHLAACEAARPDPVGLAQRLVAFELESELDAFHQAAATYEEVLGIAGLAEYRRIIEPLWAAALASAGQSRGDHYAVREAIIGIALASGDPDELIDVLQRDLRSPETYHQIVRALHAAGRDDEALDWGRRGLAAFSGRFSQAGPLREAVAALLRDRDQIPAAVALFWEGFANELSFGAYQRLMTEADLDGSRAVRREQAIELLRARTAADLSPKSPPPTNPRWIDTLASTPASTLVEVMLAMGDGDGAWEVATEYGCSKRLLMIVCELREAEHPDDIYPIYRGEIMSRIDDKNNAGYAAAVALLARIRRLTDRTGDQVRFTDLIAEIRSNHKPKRNLMALFAQRRW